MFYHYPTKVEGAQDQNGYYQTKTNRCDRNLIATKTRHALESLNVEQFK